MSTHWKNTTHLLFGVLAFLMLCLPAYTQNIPIAPDDEKALVAVTRGLCKAQVAMLGEIATHGDGHTLAFKVALVQRLVDQCGFDAVFFEANLDEFLHLNQLMRSGQGVTANDVLTAVGGTWKFYKEFQPLAPFLLARAREGRITLGGLDDQLAQLGQNYANEGMIAEFVRRLPVPEQQACISAFHRRIYFDYLPDKPYSKPDQLQLETCLADAESAAFANVAMTEEKEERQEMISATMRWISRDLTTESESVANRDRSMFQTFEWLQGRLPKKHKTIVWAATVHIAKQGNPVWGDRAGTNLGSLIARKYADRAKSLGFSAVSGSFRQGKGKLSPIPVPPVNSVEAQAARVTTGKAVYVNSKQLTTMGTRPGAFFMHTYQTFAWSDFLDAVVVFQTEHPPTDVR